MYKLSTQPDPLPPPFITQGGNTDLNPVLINGGEGGGGGGEGELVRR
jgi:hypothetical protein